MAKPVSVYADAENNWMFVLNGGKKAIFFWIWNISFSVLSRTKEFFIEVCQIIEMALLELHLK